LGENAFSSSLNNIFCIPFFNDDQNINTANSRGFTQLVTVGKGHENIKDLIADAGINCGCDTAPVQSNGGDALGMFSMLLMTLMNGLYFVRREEQRQEF